MIKRSVTRHDCHTLEQRRTHSQDHHFEANFSNEIKFQLAPSTHPLNASHQRSYQRILDKMNATNRALGGDGAADYCKTITDVIEHGLMSAISEAWAIMQKGLGMTLDQVEYELDRWNLQGELKATPLIKMGADVRGLVDATTGKRRLDVVKDTILKRFKTEQDSGTEGNISALYQHVPAPTIAAAHSMRLSSVKELERFGGNRHLGKYITPTKLILNALAPSDRIAFVEDLRMAVYVTCLAVYVQGIQIIINADEITEFSIDFKELLRIWTTESIIRTEHINLVVLGQLYSTGEGPQEGFNPFYENCIVGEFKRGYSALKKVVLRSIEKDHIVPSLSATLEYLKYMSSDNLPTTFQGLVLDRTGKHPPLQ